LRRRGIVVNLTAVAAFTQNPHWFLGGRNFYPAMLAAIAAARSSIELETYIFGGDQIGRRFLQALIQAAKLGVRVRVLADAYGSLLLAEDFFQPLLQAGGKVKFFNPLRFHRFGVRDHRKLLVCDLRTAFIGGGNIADEYDGDGIAHGWLDLMVMMDDAKTAACLTEEFDTMFQTADFRRRPLPRFRVFRPLRRPAEGAKVLAVKPGRGSGGFQRALFQDLAGALSADFIVPYFLPNRRVRKKFRRIIRRGGRVRLIVPALCDVPFARAAGMIYYARLLRAGVEIYEYQPQILHAKLFIVDENVFAGSSNLDIRSLKLNYELMLRFTDHASVQSAKDIFSTALQHSRRIELKEFRRSQNFFQRWKNHWAHFLVARIDPLVALRQFAAIEK
jgi:cardiolipin synthase